ncbi:MAG: hypothetical protein ABL908_21040 [Hyphomicrobium sp.]
MTTLDMAGSAVPASHAEATQPGLMTRVLGAWVSYQTRLARSYVDQHLKRLSDEELKEMGYGGMDVARIRAAQENAPQHWL